MYHGSKTLIHGYLEPRISYDLKPLVYGTDDYFYALVRSGNFDMNRFLVREEYEGTNKPYQLIEVIPGAFKELFDRSGYIYELNDDDFVINPDGYNEYLSSKPVKIINTIVVSNIWEEMRKYSDHYELVSYEESTPYWSLIRGGRDGYLKRKKDALERVMKVAQY